MKLLLRIFFSSFVIFISCVEPDKVDEIEVGAMIQIDSAASALLIGNTLQLTATYYDNFGHELGVDLQWSSDSKHAAVDDNGLVTGVSKGSASIYASFGDIASPSHDITVVSDPDDVASIEINFPKARLEVDEEVQLTIEARNLNGMLVEITSEITWESSNDVVITVDTNGLVSAHMDGGAEITATVDGVSSSPLMLFVGEQARTGAFMGNGYTAEGTALLTKDDNSDLILTFSSNFKTSFALGTFIYLSNSKEGGATASSGLELQEITTNGAKEFNVSSIDPNVTISTYNYVVILCKPASITFGYAELMP